MTEPEGRRISLVMVDNAGTVLGETAEFDVDDINWQEISPIAQAFPDVIVLRLLSATPSKFDKMGGRVTYLAQAPVGYDTSTLKPYSKPIVDDPLRMPWAKPGGPTDDLTWAQNFISMTGEPKQHRTWNLSSIWSIPTSAEQVWLKCVPPFFEHEAVVLKALEDFPVPRIIAHEGHRILMQPLAGVDGYNATQQELRESLTQLVELQVTTLDLRDSLVGNGVPRHSLEALSREFVRILDSKGCNDSKSMAFLDTLTERIENISNQGIPECLVHGDAHPGNFRIGISPTIIFDWGDSFIGHPFLDMSLVNNADTLQYWLSCWQSHYPDADVNYVWEQIRPIARLRKVGCSCLARGSNRRVKFLTSQYLMSAIAVNG